MKGIKKLLTGILAATMIMGASINVGATGNDASTAVNSTATITINPTKAEGDENYKEGSTNVPTYKYYEMMYATIDGTAVSYYVDKKTLADALGGLKVDGKDLFAVTRVYNTDKWIVSLNNKEGDTKFSGEEIAAALQTIKDKALVFGDTKDQVETDRNKISLEKQGYVLIESSLGSVLLADTFTTKTINEKNTYPTIDKAQKIANGDATAADYTHNAVNNEIGKKVSYQITVTIPENVSEKDITVVDTISNGLTLDTNVTVVGAVSEPAYTTATFAEDASAQVEGKKVYKLVIPAATVVANKGKTLNFQYTATINKSAVVFTPENNNAHLEYDHYVTPDVTVQAKTFGFDLVKVDKNNHDKKLANVKFTLQNTADEYYVEGTADDGKARFTSEKTILSTDANGMIVFKGLASGNYTLTEIETLSGYNLLTAPITVSIDADGKITSTGLNITSADGNSGNLELLTVENGTGLELPSTGGIGTTIFYIIGGLLIVAAVVFFVVRRKAD